ncbi:MAG TPA: MarR family transcriptional regulator [Actinomycetales bacterium]|nr:MarR family transcriptional regulator [Actinomycetales bacterium]
MPPQQPLPYDPVAEARRQWAAHGWSQAAGGMAAVTSLMRAHQIVLARVEAVLRPLGVTFARYEVLMLLHFSRSDALPMTIIGARLQVHPTSVTNAVDRLERAGLVARRPHPSDGRTTLVSLTDDGRRLALDATDRLNAAVFRAPGMPDGDLAVLVDVLAGLRRDAGDF